MKESPNRDRGLDSLRGFLIICVVLGHVPIQSFLGVKPHWWDILNQSLYLFHIPLFFALSCTFNLHSKFKNFAKSLLAIALPYLVWHAIYKYELLIQAPESWLYILITANFASLKNILWFLPALISVKILVWILYRVPNCYNRFTILLGIWLIAFSNLDWFVGNHHLIPWGLDIALFSLPFIVIVLEADENRRILKKIHPAGIAALALGIAAYLYSIEPLKTHSPWQKRIDLAQLSLPHSIESYIYFSLLGVFIFQTLRTTRISILEKLGKHSLPIFLLHYEVFKLIMNLIKRSEIPSGTWTLLISFTMGIVPPLLLSIISRRLTKSSKYLGM